MSCPKHSSLLQLPLSSNVRRVCPSWRVAALFLRCHPELAAWWRVGDLLFAIVPKVKGSNR